MYKGEIGISEKKLKRIIREVMEEFFDPDYGLEIKEEFVEYLKKSKEEELKGDTVTLDSIKKELNLE